MEIRMARLEDIPEMIRLLRKVGQVHHEIRPDLFRDGAQKYTPQELEALLADPQRPIFAAMEADHMLGYCFCQIKNCDGGAFNPHRELYIDDLCVDETCRGQHVGSLLYEYTCQYARQLGCSHVTLNVWQGNDAAMAFYQSRGMQVRSITMETKLQ